MFNCVHVDDVPGFPMSEFLLGKNATLGRNIRMLAGQNEAVFCDITSGSALKSIFYRAILQVIQITLDVII